MEARELWAKGDYARVGDLWAAPGRSLAASLDVRGRDVVDLATGTGVTALAVAGAGASSVVGVDVTPVLLAEAARRADAAGLAVRWVEADVCAVPLADGSADLVTSTFGLVFVADVIAALAEARRLLRPGGALVLTSWAGDGFFGEVRRAVAAHFPRVPEPWHETPERIVDTVGPGASVGRASFDLVVDSPAGFVDLLAEASAPIMLAREVAGPDWPTLRARLVETAQDAGSARGGAWVVPVDYLVATWSVPR